MQAGNEHREETIIMKAMTLAVFRKGGYRLSEKIMLKQKDRARYRFN